MKRRVRLTIDVDVADLSAEEREECAYIEGQRARDLPRLKEFEANEIGYLISEAIPVLDAQFFEGSGIYARFEAAELSVAEWIPRKRPKRRRRAAVASGIEAAKPARPDRGSTSGESPAAPEGAETPKSSFPINSLGSGEESKTP